MEGRQPEHRGRTLPNAEASRIRLGTSMHFRGRHGIPHSVSEQRSDFGTSSVPFALPSKSRVTSVDCPATPAGPVTVMAYAFTRARARAPPRCRPYVLEWRIPTGRTRTQE